jgi:hypothetical protein
MKTEIKTWKVKVHSEGEKLAGRVFPTWSASTAGTTLSAPKLSAVRSWGQWHQIPAEVSLGRTAGETSEFQLKRSQSLLHDRLTKPRQNLLGKSVEHAGWLCSDGTKKNLLYPGRGRAFDLGNTVLRGADDGKTFGQVVFQPEFIN